MQVRFFDELAEVECRDPQAFVARFPARERVVLITAGRTVIVVGRELVPEQEEHIIRHGGIIA